MNWFIISLIVIAVGGVVVSVVDAIITRNKPGRILNQNTPMDGAGISPTHPRRSHTKPATAAPTGTRNMRRSVIAAVTVTVLSLSLAGCDANGDAGKGQDQITTAYSALAKNSAAFYTAVADNPNPVPSPPTTAEELQRNVDYVFTDGVEIASFTRNEGICFSGPHDTFLAITGTDTPEDGIKRIFGTGECSLTDGDIVIIDNIDTQDPSSPVVDKFVKGEDLAADVTGLSDFTDYLEQAQKLSAPAAN